MCNICKLNKLMVKYMLITIVVLCIITIIIKHDRIIKIKPKEINAWIEVDGLPEPRYGMAVATYNNKIYIIGGIDRGEDKTNVFCCDGIKWTEVPGLPEPRSNMAAGVLSNMLYAVGGGESTNVYRYDGNKWTEVQSLPIKSIDGGRACLAACEYRGLFYAIGGVGGMLIRSNVFCYDGVKWIETNSLPEPRAFMSAGVWNDVIYIIGGVTMGGRSASNHEYGYDGITWFAVPQYPENRSDMNLAVLRDGIYAMSYGGCKNDDTPLYRYDGHNWEYLASVPINSPGVLGLK